MGYTFVYIQALLANKVSFCLAVKGNKSNCKLRAIFYVIAKVFGNLVVRAHQTLVFVYLYRIRHRIFFSPRDKVKIIEIVKLDVSFKKINYKISILYKMI